MCDLGVCVIKMSRNIPGTYSSNHPSDLISQGTPFCHPPPAAIGIHAPKVINYIIMEQDLDLTLQQMDIQLATYGGMD